MILLKLVYEQDIGIDEKVYTWHGVANANKELLKTMVQVMTVETNSINGNIRQLWIPRWYLHDIS
jgi:hypothetical protein